MDRKVNMIVKLMEQFGVDFEIPEEYVNESPTEEIIYDWKGDEMNAKVE